MLALQQGDTLGNHAPKGSHQRSGPTFGNGDRQTKLAADGGNLRPGEPTTDHEHPAWSGGQALLEELRIIASAQGEDALQLRLSLVEPGPRPRAGGDEEAVEIDAVPIGEIDPFGSEIQACRRNT